MSKILFGGAWDEGLEEERDITKFFITKLNIEKMNKEFKYAMGDVLKSSVTGLVGIVVGRAESIYDDDGYYLKSYYQKEEGSHSFEWVFEKHCELQSEPKEPKVAGALPKAVFDLYGK